MHLFSHTSSRAEDALIAFLPARPRVTAVSVHHAFKLSDQYSGQVVSVVRLAFRLRAAKVVWLNHQEGSAVRGL